MNTKCEVRSVKSEGGRWQMADGMSGNRSAAGGPTSRIPSTLCFFLVSFFCFLPSAFAATHVTATYGLPSGAQVMATVNGTPEYGLIFVERNEAVTWNAVEYGKTTIEGYLNASGQLNDGAGNLFLDVVPDSDASPGGSYYVVTVNIQGKVHSEIWIVPDQTTVDATLIRQTQTPAASGTTLFYQSVENAGTALTQRDALNFTGTGVSCADDAALGRTDCTITAGSGGGSGGGTVTSFSAGGLAPLFAASVANATTTPALSFSLSNAPAGSWFGNATGASAAPAFNTSTIPVSLIPALNYQTPLSSYAAPSHEFLTGFTASNTFAAARPAYSDISGTPQLANSFSALSHKWLNSFSASTGNFTGAQPAFSDLSGSITTSQQPATTVNSVANDTNVTGSIASQALTLGWTGTLAAARGGTGASSLSAANIPVQSGSITTGDCVKWASATSITDAGAACGSGGGGAVNSISGDGTLITNSGSTGAVTLSLGTAGAHKYFGNNTGSTAAPGYYQPAFTDLSGTETAAQEPATTVNSVTNDTNVTGSVSSQALTLGWTGTLATSRGGTGASSLSAANIPVQSGSITTGDCVKWASGTSITDAGAACGSGGGSADLFALLSGKLWFQYQPGGMTWGGTGYEWFVQGTQGSGASPTSSNAPYVPFTANGAANDCSALSNGYRPFWMARNPEAVGYAGITSTANITFWWGFLPNWDCGSYLRWYDLHTTVGVVAFRYSTAAPDTDFMCYTANGTAATITDSGVAADTSQHLFKIVVNSATPSATFYIDGSQVCSITTDITTAVADLWLASTSEATATPTVVNIGATTIVADK